MTDDRRGNWEDAAAVEMPPCPNPACQEQNLPGRKPLIEATWIGGTPGYHCFACDTDWTPTEPPI